MLHEVTLFVISLNSLWFDYNAIRVLTDTEKMAEDKQERGQKDE
jgi:hypothetical protein